MGRTVAIKAGVTAVLLIAGAVFAMPWLRPLGQLIPNTQGMVATTKEILKETELLQAGVGDVQTNLAKVQRQDQLLARQEQLMGSAVAELRQQQQLATDAKGLLTSITDKERSAAALTADAARAAGASMNTVNANARELERLSANTSRIQAGSEAIDGQMDRLLAQLRQSAANFEVIGRIKEAIRRALQRKWWQW